MLPDIIRFEKTAEDRRLEYINILCNDPGPISSSQIEHEWHYYIEAVLEPTGWQAVWKLSLRECDDLHVPFPMAAFVVVENVEFESLSATVNVLKIPANINIPEKLSTSLLQLYPTLSQVNDILYVEQTAKCLDQLRFFYNHLWFPWDTEDNSQNWIDSHLNERLNLYYDMKSGKIPCEMVENIMSLLSEARVIQNKISDLEESIDDIDNEDSLDENKACNLIELRICLHKIKKEIQVMENPAIRTVLAVKPINPNVQSKRQGKEISLVWRGGSLCDYVDILSKVKDHVDSDAFLKPFPLLQEALDSASAGDTVVVCPGVYGIRGVRCLENGGKITGFSTPEATVVAAHDAGNVLIDCTGNDLRLENLKIDGRKTDVAILVRSGRLMIRNCHILGRENSSTSRGIVVFGKGKVELENCVISCFGTALYINTEAEVCVKSSRICSCHIGIQVFGGAKLYLHDSTILNCKYYGIKCDVHSVELINNDYRIGSEELLTNISEIKLDNTTVEDNAKGDVIIMKNHESCLYDYLENMPFYSAVTIK
ncbi:protein nessun dorma-like isoform X1 [Schistocerca nitens]|uniref:protein nessun dorma-like isoform X1 n=1 Tax=Schistocerca nitens TaxID=7011 RepID=UPI002118FEEB|nr:protein nessun dorma-like isoform X1 [Schistocerca nitens]